MSGEWGKFLLVIGALLLAWLLFRQIRGNPEAFSRENWGKSLYVLGILALLLIVFIWLLVVMLK
jgi:hypothetical protein